MINICIEHGDDIAYEGSNCPACDQIEEIYVDNETKVGELEKELVDSEDTILELEDTIEELESDKE